MKNSDDGGFGTEGECFDSNSYEYDDLGNWIYRNPDWKCTKKTTSKFIRI